jgi:hypothetical protein
MNSSLVVIFRYVSVTLIFWCFIIWMYDVRIKTLEERIIGEKTVIDNIEVAEYDIFGSYFEVVEKARKLGQNWRIPTIEEYKLIKENNLLADSSGYWSSVSEFKNPSNKMIFFTPGGNIEPNSTNEYDRFFDNTRDHAKARLVRTISIDDSLR